MVKRTGDVWEPVLARAALAGALARQVAEDPRGLRDAAGGCREHDQDAGAERAPGRPQAGGAGRNVHGSGQRQPAAEIPPARIACGGSAAPPASAIRSPSRVPRAASYTPGLRTAPLIVTSAEPGAACVPTEQNQSGPYRAIRARCASVSTLLTSVGGRRHRAQTAAAARTQAARSLR